MKNEQEECCQETTELVETETIVEEAPTWEQERQDLLHQLACLKADYDNFRRRTKNQMEDFRKYASESLVRDLLPILDDLELALEAKKEEDPFALGVRMVYQNFVGCLEKQGLTKIEAQHQEFDSRYHDAVSMVDEGGESVFVTKVLKTGYRFHQKVLRPSMVETAKKDISKEEEASWENQ